MIVSSTKLIVASSFVITYFAFSNLFVLHFFIFAKMMRDSAAFNSSDPLETFLEVVLSTSRVTFSACAFSNAITSLCITHIL